MELMEAFEKIQGDRKLAKRFVEDPTGVLEGLGVASKKKFFIEHRTLEAADTMALEACIEVCFYVGVPFVGCTTVGTKQGL